MASYYCIIASFLAWAGIFLSTVILAVIVRRLRKMRNRRLIKKDWKPNVTYLVQFPPSAEIRSISPFCLKLETWFRMHQIPYENVYSVSFSRKGQTPFIELNGEQWPDSNFIIRHLEDRYSMHSTKATATDKAVAHAFSIMIENHTCLASFYWRYGLHMAEFFDKLVKPHFPPGIGIGFFFRRLEPIMVRLRCYMHGIGRHSDEEMATVSMRDLDAISAYLGETKQYFLGDKPGTVDCTLFAHLVQFVYLPLEIPQKLYVEKHCSNLIAYCDRMRIKFWPDWTEIQ